MAENKKDIEVKIEGLEKSNCKENYLKTSFAHNQELIKLADSKANIVLGLISFLIPLIFGINVYSTYGKESTKESIILLNVFAFISIILLGISFILAISVIYARLNNSKNGNKLFYKNIESMKFNEYQAFVRKLTDDIIFGEYTQEIHEIAKINKKKYYFYNYSVIFLLSGIAVLIVGYLISIGLNFN